VTLHDIASVEGTDFLVMEYVPGRSLDQLISPRGLPLIQGVGYAQQLAGALAAAHTAGIVHRDIKPANVIVTPQGQVKVLDFGLAKLLDRAPQGPESETRTAASLVTEPGRVMGTVAYMSPEQASGHELDHRTDIFSLGIVLYEMLAGKRPFDGKSHVDTMHAIINDPPPPLSQPPELHDVLDKTLAKDPKDRYQHAGDLALDLRRLLQRPPEARRATSGTGRSRRMRMMWILGGAVAIVMVALAGAPLWQARSSAARIPAANVARLTATLDAPDWFALDRPTLAWSPDGARLIYQERNDAGARLYARPIDQFGSQPIVGTETAVGPFPAPDGDRIGFVLNGKLRTLSLDAGTSTDVCAVATVPLGAAWISADTIVLGSMNGSGLWQVPASGGTPQAVGGSQSAEARPAEAWPAALPDGRSVLYTVMPADGKPAYLAVASVATGERKVLIEGSAAQYVSTGHLVYLLGSSLMGVRFDPERFEVVGHPVRLVDDVQQVQGAGAAQFAVSSTGSLVYVSRVSRSAPKHLVLADRRGQAEQIAQPARSYGNPRVSPDGQRIVVDVQGPTGTDIWAYDVPRGTWSQLTFNARSGVPVWTPDGKRITFVVATDGRSKLYWKAADGGGPDELLSTEPGNPHSWAPDGRLLARAGGNPTGGGGSQVMLLSMDGGRETRPLLAKREGTEMAAPAIHPSGRWIAYVANDSGRRQVYVRPFPEGEGRWLVSVEGGTQPMWGRNGQELFYRDGDKMMAVRVTTTPVFRADTPRLLFEGHYESPAVRANYDVMADGQHFVMVKAAEQESTNRRLNIVVNWGEELKRLAPGNE